MSENERVHFKIALPVGLKKQLEHEAVENRRSLSAEIIARLEGTLVRDTPSDDGWIEGGLEFDRNDPVLRPLIEEVAEETAHKTLQSLVDLFIAKRPTDEFSEWLVKLMRESNPPPKDPD